MEKLGPDNQQTIVLEGNLAIALWRVGRLAEAIPKIRHVRQQLIRTSGGSSGRIAMNYTNEGGMHRDLGDYASAERCFEAARRIYQKANGGAKADPAALEIAYARLRRAQKNYSAAIEHFSKALEALRIEVGEMDWQYTHTRSEYADILAEAGREQEAESEARASYDDLRVYYGPHTTMVKKPLRSLLGLYRKQGRTSEAATMAAALENATLRPLKIGA
jgi:tetratricopeptide (TPR) repeat protein